MSLMELTLVLLVALLVFGPEKLPALAKTLAKLVVKAQGIKNYAHELVKEEEAKLQLQENLKKAKLAESKLSPEHQHQQANEGNQA